MQDMDNFFATCIMIAISFFCGFILGMAIPSRYKDDKKEDDKCSSDEDQL